MFSEDIELTASQPCRENRCSKFSECIHALKDGWWLSSVVRHYARLSLTNAMLLYVRS